MFKQYRLRDYRFRLVFYVYAISIIGVMVIGSARKSVQSQQIVGLALGTAAMLVVSLMDYTWVLKFYWLIYVFNIALLAMVKIPFVGIEPVIGADTLCQYPAFWSVEERSIPLAEHRRLSIPALRACQAAYNPVFCQVF